MSNDHPLFSIIVPVYNTECTLPACLDSALAQTVHDVEVICVNDGSPDGSANILSDYAARDERIRVITQENAGLSAARNAGIDAARGEYLVFLDSDDTIEPILCERVRSAFDAATDVDVVTFGARCEPEDRASARIKRLLSPADAIYTEFDGSLLFSANAQPYAWRTVLTRAFCERERIRFDESLRFAEDVPFHFTVYPLARTTVLLSDKLYHYRMVEGSLTHVYNASASRERKLMQHLDVLESIFLSWRAHGIDPLCPAEMIAWCLDFTLFDIAGVSESSAMMAAHRLSGLLTDAYGESWFTVPANAAVRRAAQAVAHAERGMRLSKIDLMRFFVATRGLVQCVERVFRRG